MDKIFLSWSDYRSKELAKIIKPIIESLTRIEVFFSEDIEKGADWWKTVLKELNDSNAFVTILTPENINSNWIHYEAGAFLTKENDSLYILKCFTENEDYKIERPLGSFQASMCSSESIKEELVIICERILRNAKALKNNTINKGAIKTINWDLLTNTYDRLKNEHQPKVSNKIKKNLELLDTKIENAFLDFILNKKIHDFNLNVKNVASKSPSISFDYVSYPDILIGLTDQYENEIGIKAVAVVDDTEGFWNDTTAIKIMMQGSHEMSERIFIFNDQKHLTEYLPRLQRWSQSYNVRVISKRKAESALRNSKPRDFSVISKRNQYQILARYYKDDSESDYQPLKVRFTTDAKLINRYLNDYNILFKKSHEVRPNFELKLNDQAFIQLIFEEDKIKRHYAKNIEMSGYIDIEAYDNHEEEHPFYMEMVASILGHIKENTTDAQINILEVGAGTGLFTKHLIERMSNISLDCLEIDAECFDILEERISRLKEITDQKNSTVRVLKKDSRTYIDPYKKYDYVISVFADHHIKPLDQVMYFTNIAKNLKPNGMFIVGDEFLRNHDENNVLEWKKALKDYHNFIIKEAINAGNIEVAELERQALHSGLLEIGDFKISTEQYEEFLEEANLQHKEFIIGPKNTKQDIGGIYVYTIQKK